jgi:hypothetical protein
MSMSVSDESQYTRLERLIACDLVALSASPSETFETFQDHASTFLFQCDLVVYFISFQGKARVVPKVTCL